MARTLRGLATMTFRPWLLKNRLTRHVLRRPGRHSPRWEKCAFCVELAHLPSPPLGSLGPDLGRIRISVAFDLRGASRSSHWATRPRRSSLASWPTRPTSRKGRLGSTPRPRACALPQRTRLGPAAADLRKRARGPLKCFRSVGARGLCSSNAMTTASGTPASLEERDGGVADVSRRAEEERDMVAT
jgi:hypothetical protein